MVPLLAVSFVQGTSEIIMALQRGQCISSWAFYQNRCVCRIAKCGISWPRVETASLWAFLRKRFWYGSIKSAFLTWDAAKNGDGWSSAERWSNNVYRILPIIDLLFGLLAKHSKSQNVIYNHSPSVGVFTWIYSVF